MKIRVFNIFAQYSEGYKRVIVVADTLEEAAGILAKKTNLVPIYINELPCDIFLMGDKII